MDSEPNNPYLNHRDPDLPFKHTDNNHHFNSWYVVEYTNHSTKHKCIFVTIQVQFSLTLNIQNVGLSNNINNQIATKPCLKILWLSLRAQPKISIAYTVDNHTIIATMRHSLLKNSKHTVTVSLTQPIVSSYQSNIRR